MNSPKDFSVLMAVYKKDDPRLLGSALDSIFANSLQPSALVLVADGELTDELLLVIQQYSVDSRLQLLQLPVNVGLAEALNAGLQKIRTTYTVRADADDVNHRNRFEQLIAKLQQGFDLVGSSIKEVDKSGQFVAVRRCPASESEICQFIRKRNPFNHMAVAFRTEVVLAAGGYPSIHLKEDYALWASLVSRNCRVCNLETVLVDATAGTEMFQRRGGLRYALAEIDLQRHLVRCGLKSIFSAMVDGIMRSAIFLAPNTIREFIYLRYLRG
jgi:glycosyltransferase involved in cell wall biosynthesis